MPSIYELSRGIVVETKTTSFLGSLMYSERRYPNPQEPVTFSLQPMLNDLSRISVVGIFAGITRVALAAIHTVGHLFAALFTFNQGHLYHAAKGGCEMLKGLIETLPFVGRKFARLYTGNGVWWMIKIYNPEKPDSLDLHVGLWKTFKQLRPNNYVLA